MSNSISVTTETESKGQKLKDEVVTPEVRRFEEWYARPENAGTGLLRIERDILTLYLHAKLSGRF